MGRIVPSGFAPPQRTLVADSNIYDGRMYRI
jgi:hypothetical protein